MTKKTEAQPPVTQPRPSDKPEVREKTEALVDELLDKVSGGTAATMCGDCVQDGGGG